MTEKTWTPLTPEEDAEILRLRRRGLTIGQIVQRVKRSRCAVRKVLAGRPSKRLRRDAGGPCVECGTETGPFFDHGGMRCVKHAGLAEARARGRKV